jgi:hypothetical protein
MLDHAMTPEGKIKRGIKAVLDKYSANIYYYMPVPGGYGRSTLDYLGFCCGLGFAVEAKRPKGRPTERQQGMIEDIERGGAKVFVVNDVDTLKALDDWLNVVSSGMVVSAH